MLLESPGHKILIILFFLDLNITSRISFLWFRSEFDDVKRIRVVKQVIKFKLYLLFTLYKDSGGNNKFLDLDLETSYRCEGVS